MKACALAGMLVLALDDVSAAVADPDPLAVGPAAAAAQAAPGARLSGDTLRKAVRAALAQEAPAGFKPDGPALRGDPYREFGRQFSEAQKPSCFGPDALKHQPHSMVVGGWTFGVTEMMALPFWGAAVVRGKCR